MTDASMTMVHKGTITGFYGNWMSGLATLELVKPDGSKDFVHCENAPTVRALNAAFGDVIGGGHTVDPEGGHIGQTIYYFMDDLGLCLGGFVPEASASPELVEIYEEQHAVKRPRPWWEKAEDLRCDCGSDKPLVNVEAGNVPGTRLCEDCGKAWLVASDGESMTALNNGREKE